MDFIKNRFFWFDELCKTIQPEIDNLSINASQHPVIIEKTYGPACFNDLRVKSIVGDEWYWLIEARIGFDQDMDNYNDDAPESRWCTVAKIPAGTCFTLDEFIKHDTDPDFLMKEIAQDIINPE